MAVSYTHLDVYKRQGLDYSMMTPYTSFIAVTETVRSQDGSAADVNQPLPLPLHVSNFAVGAGYTIGSEPETLILLCAAGVIMAAGCILSLIHI